MKKQVSLLYTHTQKDKKETGRKYLQIIYPTKDCCLEYIKISQNSVVKKFLKKTEREKEKGRKKGKKMNKIYEEWRDTSPNMMANTQKDI